MRLFRRLRPKRPPHQLSYEEHVRERAALVEAELRSGAFELVSIDPVRTLRFLGEREPLFYPQERVDELRERRSAQAAFYGLCRDGTVDLESNPYLDWMRARHPDGGWHGVRTDPERVRMCERHRALFAAIARDGIEVPLRILQAKHFHLTDVKRAADGGNRLQIAAVLGLATVPNLIRRDLVAEAKAHGLL